MVSDQAVAALMREASDRFILPRFQALAPEDRDEKSPGDFVTIADRDSEAFLTERLKRLLPGSTVVGEEAAHEKPEILKVLTGDAPVWVVDPLDGTGNFASGLPNFAVMVALLYEKQTKAAYIFQPVENCMAIAQKGRGTFINGQRVRLGQTVPPATALKGAVSTVYLPPSMKPQIALGTRDMADTATSRCAGQDYLAILTGAKDFSLYYRTLPWDHAAGALMVAEAGGCAQRYDRTPYNPADDKSGLLSASSPKLWQELALTMGFA